jgi:hypothetical protein
VRGYDWLRCITLFQRIDPGVQRIHTTAGDVPGMSYIKVDGKWIVGDGK